MQVDILLSCGHIITIPIGSILELPTVGSLIRCARCQEGHTVSMVGIPYSVEKININQEKRENR